MALAKTGSTGPFRQRASGSTAFKGAHPRTAFASSSFFLILVLFGFTTMASAQNTSTPAGTTGLTHLYSLDCTLGAPISVGAVPAGTRVAIPITGGTFSGPRLNGTIMNLGADWGLYDSSGVFSPDTRYNLVTSDGANIFAQTSGSQQPDGPWAFLRIKLETGDARYNWLNYVVAVGVLTRVEGGIHLEAWQLKHEDEDSESVKAWRAKKEAEKKEEA